MSTTDPRADIGSASTPAGQAVSWTVTVKDSSGAVVPLTTYGTTWTGNLRAGSADSQPAVAWSVDSTNAATGVLVLNLTAAQTATMATASGAHTDWTFDLEVSGGTVSPQFPFKGTLTVWKVYTHA